jgi:TonB family protein
VGLFLKTHAVSLLIHAGLVALALLFVRGAVREKDPGPERIEFVVAEEKAPDQKPPEPPPRTPPPVPTQERPAEVPEDVKVTMVERPRPFQQRARPGPREVDAPAVPAPTTPIRSVDMEATVDGESEYVSTSKSEGTVGVREGSGAPAGGGDGERGPAANQGALEARVSPDWEITSQPEPLNDHEFEPAYPTVAKREAREGVVVVQLWIDEQGNVGKATVVEPAGHGFDESALAYARRLRFSPARAGARAVAAKIEWTVEFNARN